MKHRIERREFIALLGGAAAWPLAARAQGREQARRIGVLAPLTADDPESQVRNAGFLQGLADLGWRVGLNIEIEYRWAASDPERIRQAAGELVALAPDVILATGTGALGALLRVTSTVPVVFVNATDPVGGGFVASLAHPGGNATGFTMLEYGMSGKWLELLKQVSPHITRVAVLRDPALASGSGQFGAIQAVAPFLGVEVSPIDVRDPGEIERGITEFAGGSNGGLIVTSGRFAFRHRALIIMLAARHQLPTVYPYRSLVASGGLISFGPSSTDSFRRAAGYVDRILKGEKAADLPVQAPTKFELVINLKSAKALGLEVPPTLLAGAARRRSACAQPGIGFLRVGPPPSTWIEGLQQGLRELGYIDGENIAIEFGLASNVAQVPEILADLIPELALKNRLPFISSTRELVSAGGLMSYGPNTTDLYRRAADYVVKILRGSKPADLPVQQPIKFELVINLNTAKALGLTVPPTLLARADEVIE